MLLDKALSIGMSYQDILYEGKDFNVDKEELLQFVNVSIVALTRIKALDTLVSEELYNKLP